MGSLVTIQEEVDDLGDGVVIDDDNGSLSGAQNGGTVPPLLTSSTASEIDFALAVLTGDDRADDDIFQQMVPPPVDLDEYIKMYESSIGTAGKVEDDANTAGELVQGHSSIRDFGENGGPVGISNEASSPDWDLGNEELTTGIRLHGCGSETAGEDNPTGIEASQFRSKKPVFRKHERERASYSSVVSRSVYGPNVEEHAETSTSYLRVPKLAESEMRAKMHVAPKKGTLSHFEPNDTYQPYIPKNAL